MAWTSGLTTIGSDATVSAGTSVVAVSNNTKGDWFELSAATAAAAWGFFIQITYRTSNSQEADVLLDIGIGAAAAETAIVSNLLCQTNAARQGISTIFVPLEIAAGSRVSVRGQFSSGIAATVDAVGVSLILVGKDTQAGATSAQTYGANTTDSGGTGVDPGGSANTKGAYSQLSASTSADINWLIVMLGGLNTGRTSCNWLLDIATGAASSESVVIGDIAFATSSVTDILALKGWSFPVPAIPSGTRLSARAACSINDATDRLFDVVVIGLNVPQITGGGGGATSVPFFGMLG